jgi:hypothetical protein
MRGSVFWWALSLAVLLFWSPLTAQGQSSTPPSTATVQPSSPITPTERVELLALKSLLDPALTSSETSDSLSRRQAQQIEDDRLQKIADDKERQIEQQQSAQALQALSSRVEKLQTFSDKLLPMLTDFSGSEDEKQAHAIVAVDDIKGKAKALETQVSVFRIGCITFGVGLGAVAIYEGGHALKWW